MFDQIQTEHYMKKGDFLMSLMTYKQTVQTA